MGGEEDVRLHLTLDEPDDERLDELTSKLRRELLELDVVDVRRPQVEAPAGTRGAGTEVGQLIVTSAPVLLGPILETVQGWLASRRARIAVTLPNGTTVELDGADRRQVDEVLELARGQQPT